MQHGILGINLRFFFTVKCKLSTVLHCVNIRWTYRYVQCGVVLYTNVFVVFDAQVSESGIHRPHVAGIHGRSNDGAYSLVLAGGYEDDVVRLWISPKTVLQELFPFLRSPVTLCIQDDGNEFTYTGSGGRDLSGNKRTAEQSCDQKLTNMNRSEN